MQSEFCFVWDFPADCYKIRLIRELELNYCVRKPGVMLDVVGIECIIGNFNRPKRILTVNDTNASCTYKIHVDELYTEPDSSYFQLNAVRYYNLPCEVIVENNVFPKQDCTISIDIIFLGKRKTYMEITDFITMLENMIQQAKDERK